MSDLISRSALIKAIKDMQRCFWDYEEINDEYCNVITLVNEQPTVEAVPVVHGEWIDTQPEYHIGFRNNAQRCSNCSDYYTTEPEDLFFCPTCDFAMDDVSEIRLRRKWNTRVPMQKIVERLEEEAKQYNSLGDRAKEKGYCHEYASQCYGNALCYEDAIDIVKEEVTE